MAINPSFSLYGAAYCHLCDDAKHVLSKVIASEQLQLVDISDSFELKKAYGLRIPVLKHNETGAELNWPFDKSKLLEFIQ